VPPRGRKLDRRRDYLDISALFGSPLAAPLVRLLAPTSASPHAVTLGALAAGLAAAACVARADAAGFLAGALLVQLKNVLDTVDGGLARARETPSWIGRYLDSLVDFVVCVALHSALGVALVRGGMRQEAAIALCAAAALSGLIQGSFYVHHTVRYLRALERAPVSRLDERPVPERDPVWRREAGWRLAWLHRTHVILYGWQDALVRRWVEGWSGRAVPDAIGADHRGWLTAASVLGLGTHLAAFSIGLLLGRPLWYLALIIVAGNLYLVALSAGRRRAAGRPTAGSLPEV